MATIKILNSKYLVTNNEIPSMGELIYDTVDKAVDAVELENWFNREMKALNRPVYLADVIEYRTEWGLPLGNLRVMQ